MIILDHTNQYNGEYHNPLKQSLSTNQYKKTGVLNSAHMIVFSNHQKQRHTPKIAMPCRKLDIPKSTGLINGYGSIPINTIFSGMNIHLPAILMFTRGTRFWHTAKSFTTCSLVKLLF